MREPRRGHRSGLQDAEHGTGIGGDPSDPGVRRDRPAQALTAHEVVDRLFRQEQGRAVATLIRALGDFDLAEDAVQDAFAEALRTWPARGVPSNPAAWITTTARNRAIDRLRRQHTLREKNAQLAALEELGGDEIDVSDIPDERLRLIFTCCHPALPSESRVALTLKTVAGLSTVEIARGFLASEDAIAKRIVRAKAKIRAAGIPYRVPPPELLGERLPGVLAVLYLVFNEGYAATSGELMRTELCEEAIRLGTLIRDLMPGETECAGLVALMLLQHSRRHARVSPNGELVLLEDQDRARWDHEMIDEGLALLDATLRAGHPGPFQVQAAIAALHARAPRPEDTDWPQIAALYTALHEMMPTPVVALNRAVAIAMADGAARGLPLVEALAGDLDGYFPFHAARADLLLRLDRRAEAATSYRHALALVTNATERTFIERRLKELTRPPT